MNINDYVWVKVTRKGEEVYAKHYRDLGMDPPKLNKDFTGFSRFQLWDLMNIFGDAMYNGGAVPIETTIHLTHNDY